MFKVKSKEFIREMGFVKNDVDYVIRGKNVNGGICTLFTIYKGSPYIRFARMTQGQTEEQLKLIHEWTKKDYIEWEEI